MRYYFKSKLLGVYCIKLKQIKLNKMKTKENYNGWTNYATWRVNLELFDGYELNKLNKDLDTYELSQYLKEYAEYYVCEDTDNSELCKSYALAFLDQVNYYEIAEHINEMKSYETNI